MDERVRTLIQPLDSLADDLADLRLVVVHLVIADTPPQRPSRPGVTVHHLGLQLLQRSSGGSVALNIQPSSVKITLGASSAEAVMLVLQLAGGEHEDYQVECGPEYSQCKGASQARGCARIACRCVSEIVGYIPRKQLLPRSVP